MRINWSAVYNRLFKIIDQPMPLYFSGPKFIQHVQEVNADFPNYNEFLKKREFDNKSTTRAVYFRDILLEMPEKDRFLLVSSILASVEKYAPNECSEVRKMLSGGALAPSATVPDHAWNSDRLNQYLREMDGAIVDRKYPLAITLSYTCFEGFLGAYLRAKAPSDEYPREIIRLAILTREHLKSMFTDWPPEVLNNLSHAAYAVDRARNAFSDSHFGAEADMALATYIRDLVNTQIRLLLHFM
jgi:hypothetical protein